MALKDKFASSRRVTDNNFIDDKLFHTELT